MQLFVRRCGRVATAGGGDADTPLGNKRKLAGADAESPVGIVDSAILVDTYNPVNSFDYYYSNK